MKNARLPRLFDVMLSVGLAAVCPATMQAQTWNEQGPNGIQNNGNQTNITPNSTVSGAIRTILADPGNANVIYTAGVNGGVWKSTDAGTNWSPLTDNNTQFKSFSISTLAFDQSTSNTIYAGYGAFSSFGGTSGQLAGLMRSTNNGATWTAINGTGGVSMLDRQVYDIYARGNTIVASTSFTNGANNYGNIGMYRSTDGGNTYQIISGNAPGNAPNGIPGGYTIGMSGKFTGGQDILLTATQFATTNAVYRSTDGGATWSNVNNAAMNTLFTGNNVGNVKFAFGPNNTAYAAIVTNGQLSGLFRSTNNGATWSASSLDLTNTGQGGGGVNPGGQGDTHLSLVADPTNQNIVYVGGDRSAGGPFAARIFRVDASLASGSQTSLFTNADTSNNSAPHADTRVMTFDVNGQVLLGGDGGIYRRNIVTAGAGQWTSLNALRITEVTGIAYDRITKAVITGQQDNGTAVMSPNVNVNTAFASKTWTNLNSGDGGKPAADPLTVGAGTVATNAVRYHSSQFLGGETRRSYDSTNTQVSSTSVSMTVSGQTIFNYENAAYPNFNGNNSGTIQFLNPIAVNQVEGGRFYVGTRRIYESTNQGANMTDLNGDLAASAGFAGGTTVHGLNVNAIAAGGRSGVTSQPNVLYVGTSSVGSTNVGGQLFVRPATGTALSAVTVLTAYSTAAGTVANNSSVLDVTMDTANWQKPYVVTPARVWSGTVTTGPLASSWLNFTGNLTPGGTLFTDAQGNFTQIEFVPVSGQAFHGAIVVGTTGGLFFDFTDDATHTWMVLTGANLPNAYVSDIQYDMADDILVVGTLGRGVWTLPNASVYFSTVSVPEPTTIALCAGSGLFALLAAVRYRRKLQLASETRIRRS